MFRTKILGKSKTRFMTSKHFPEHYEAQDNQREVTLKPIPESQLLNCYGVRTLDRPRRRGDGGIFALVYSLPSEENLHFTVAVR